MRARLSMRLERDVEGFGQGVGGEEVQGPAHDERRCVRVAVHQLAQRGTDPLGGVNGRPVARCGPGQPVQVRAGIRVEAQRAAERFEYLG